MENWNYYISGIWKEKHAGTEIITDVFLHTAAGGLSKGVKTSKDEVIDLLRHGAKICTITWNYHLIQWRFGAKVMYSRANGKTWLHTEEGAAIFDELESSIQMQYILDEQAVISH